MRRKSTIIVAALASSCLFAPGAGAAAQLGHQYFEAAAGWKHIENGSSDNGAGFRAEWNAPIMFPQSISPFGMDLVVRGEGVDIFDRTMWDAQGVVRGYMRQEGGFYPFGGVGFGYLDLDEVGSTYLPVEAGVEFGVGNVSVMPFARYSFTLHDTIGDFWTAGAKGVLWFHPDTWGLTASIEYTDYDDGDTRGSFDSGIAIWIGAVFDY